MPCHVLFINYHSTLIKTEIWENSNLFYETYEWSFHIKFACILNKLYSYVHSCTHRSSWHTTERSGKLRAKGSAALNTGKKARTCEATENKTFNPQRQQYKRKAKDGAMFMQKQKNLFQMGKTPKKTADLMWYIQAKAQIILLPIVFCAIYQ